MRLSLQKMEDYGLRDHLNDAIEPGLGCGVTGFSVISKTD